ncbi:MAG: linalool dehydratase/isomerase domain-containing protein [Candidatus Helarchaeota archaeon]
MNVWNVLKKNKYIFCCCIILSLFIIITIIEPINVPSEPSYPVILTDEGTFNLSQYPHLRNKQIGQLNYFRNIVFGAELDNFENMEPKIGDEVMSFGPGGDAGLRYVIGFSTYAISEMVLNTPGYRYYYQSLIDRYIQKMQTLPVIDYWNKSSGRYNGKSYYQFTVDTYGVPHGDYYGLNYTNIMYRGHWLLMMTMYRYLFGDTKYDKNMTWQLTSLYDEMMNESHPTHQYHRCPLVPCEPDEVFTQCNSVQRLAFAIYNKSINNGSDPIDYFKAIKKSVAWELENATNSKGLYYNGMNTTKYKLGLNYVSDQDSGYTQAWTLAFMRGYNKTIADQLYPIYKQYYVVENLYPGITGEIAFLKEDYDMSTFSADFFQFGFSIAASGFGLMCASEFGDYETRTKFERFFDSLISGKWNGNIYLYETPGIRGLEYVYNMIRFWGSMYGVSLANFTQKRSDNFFNNPYISDVSDPKNIFINQAIYDESKTAFILTCTALTPGSITITNLNSSSKVFSVNNFSDWSFNSGNITINVQPGTYNFVIENR